jgi:signal transduction histidine kinase
MVTADREKIEQVLVNLLSNAAKYSEKDLPIAVNCAVGSNQVEVAIKDKGMGISAEDVQNLFQPHYRVERAETENIAGLGSVYICPEIVQSHKGQIWVEASRDKAAPSNLHCRLDPIRHTPVEWQVPDNEQQQKTARE